MRATTIILIVLILKINLASALIVNSVDVDTLSPGQEGQIRIELKNILNGDVTDVSLSLFFENLPFIPIGSSTQSTDEIKEDDDDVFVFRVKAATNLIPGDYEIPYILEYEFDNDLKTRSGTVGIKTRANPDLVFSLDTENAIIDQKGQIIFIIINKGFFEARFLTVRVFPSGFTLLSDTNEYIGEVESDDFETAIFDVIFNKKNANFIATVEYVDFDNERVIKTVKLPVRVYTREEARELGLIQQSLTSLIVSILMALVLLYILWRAIRRRRKLRKSKANIKSAE